MALVGTWPIGDLDLFRRRLATRQCRVVGPRSHVIGWAQACSTAHAWFEGVASDRDRHCHRVNASALALGLQAHRRADEMGGADLESASRSSTAIRRSISGRTVLGRAWRLYGVPADLASTRFCLCLYLRRDMIGCQTASRVTVSPISARTRPWKPCPTMPKAGCLVSPIYGSGSILEAKSRGFDNALVLDMLGNVAETGSSNIFMVRDGEVFTPAPNGTFLSGITRSRIIDLLRQSGRTVTEKTLSVKDFMEADEIFSTGNHSKVVPVIRIEERDLQPGPVAKTSRDAYWEWAHS